MQLNKKVIVCCVQLSFVSFIHCSSNETNLIFKISTYFDRIQPKMRSALVLAALLVFTCFVTINVAFVSPEADKDGPEFCEQRINTITTKGMKLCKYCCNSFKHEMDETNVKHHARCKCRPAAKIQLLDVYVGKWAMIETTDGQNHINKSL